MIMFIKLFNEYSNEIFLLLSILLLYVSIVFAIDISSNLNSCNSLFNAE